MQCQRTDIKGIQDSLEPAQERREPTHNMVFYRSYTKARLIFLFSYWSVMVLGVYFFIAYGDGSIAPFFILSSWAGLVVKVLSLVLQLGESGLLLGGLVVYLSFFILYYLGLLRFVTWLRARKKQFLVLVPFSIHIGGGISMMLISNAENLLPPRGLSQQVGGGMIRFFLASYLISWAITMIWLIIDWRLAGRQVGKRAEGI